MLAQIVLISSAVALLIAISEICVKRRRISNYYFFAIFMCIATVEWVDYLWISRKILNYPHFFHVQVPVYFVVGPCVFFYFRMKIDEDYQWRRRDLLHFIPALVVLLMSIPILGSGAVEKLVIIEHYYSKNYASVVYSGLLLLLGLIHLTGYTAWMLSTMRSALNIHNIRKETTIRIIFILGSCGALLLILSFIFWIITPQEMNLMPPGWKYSVLFTALMVPIFFVLKRRYPYFFEDLSEVVQVEKYKKSQLGNVDVQYVGDSLQKLLGEEHLYLDPDLGLKDLARELNLTQHQLSEFINSHLKTNFSSLLNNYRISYAKKQLLEHPNRTVLGIAFEAGYNTKANFNKAFLKIEGLTPSQFRRKNAS